MKRRTVHWAAIQTNTNARTRLTRSLNLCTSYDCDDCVSTAICLTDIYSGRQFSRSVAVTDKTTKNFELIRKWQAARKESNNCWRLRKKQPIKLAMLVNVSDSIQFSTILKKQLEKNCIEKNRLRENVSVHVKFAIMWGVFLLSNQSHDRIYSDKPMPFGKITINLSLFFRLFLLGSVNLKK